MAVLEKERVEERRDTEERRPREAAPRRRFGLAVGALAILAVAAVVAAVVIVASGSESDGGDAAPPAAVQMPDARSDEQILADLATAGYIPWEAVDSELLDTEKLVNRGQVPEQTLRPYSEPVEPLFTAEELKMIELAATGQIPKEAVDWETIETKRMVNQGLIPREAAE